MKKNRIVRSLLCAASIALTMPSITSCEDFLEEKEVPRLTADYYATQQGVDAAAIAAYGYLRFGVSGEYFSIFNELGNDLTTGADGGIGKPTNDYGNGLISTSFYFWDLWKNYYKGINTTNLVIDNVPNGSMKPAEKTMALAEMYFLRAYCYYDLVQVFGRIPLVLEASYEVRTDFQRTSVATIYNQIITDLRFSAEHLRETTSKDGGDYGKATRYAASHLLSKVYLTRCSAVTEDRGKKTTDADSALYYAQKVIECPKYKLQDNFSDLWDPNNQGNSEIIYAVQFTTDSKYNGSGNLLHLYWGSGYDKFPGMQRDLENGRPYTYHRATNRAMFELFDRKNDSRFYKTFKWVYYCNKPTAGLALGDTAIYYSLNPDPTIGTDGKSKLKYTYIAWNKNDPDKNNSFFPPVLKYFDPNRLSVNEPKGTREWVRMRLGETYLLAAEAAGRKGDFAKAADYINVLRKRAAWHDNEVKLAQYWKEEGGEKDNVVSTYSEIKVTASELAALPDFVDFILDERGRELFGELTRVSDLNRCEKLYEYVKTRNYNPYAAKTIKEFHKLKPIPQKHIDRLKPVGDISEEQNPGYY